MAELHRRLEYSPRLARCGLLGLLMLLGVREAAAETVTMTTYYPAPSGVYNQVITTSDTWLARDGGRVTIGLNSASNVKLDVAAGLTKLGSLAAEPAGVDGAIYYNSASGSFRGFKGGAWADLGGGSPIPNMVVLGTPGAFSWTAPAGVTRVMVELWGGGGGGSASVWCGSNPGPGGGAFGRGVYTVTPGASYAIVVGIGGATDTNGGASSFGALISAGGGGSSPAGGLGGVSAAPFNCPGQTGKIKFSGDAGCGGGRAGDPLGQYPAVGPGGGGGCGSTSRTGGPGRVVVYY